MQMLRMLDIDALDVPEQIPHGDMPGDGVTIGQDNIERAKTVLSAIQGTLERRLEGCEKNITVAVMGCVVNGPGEAAAADVGIAGGDGEGLVFRRGKILYKVPEDKLVDALMNEIEKL